MTDSPFPGTGATQQDIDVWTFRNVGPDGIRIVVDILLSLTFALDECPSADPAHGILEYVGEALHGGDYDSSQEQHDDPEEGHEFLLTVDIINLAATWVLNRSGGDVRTALAQVEKLRALAFTGADAI